MGAVARGVRNAFRNGIRSMAVIIILALSIGTALVMLISMKAVDGKISSVKSSVGNTVTVSPAGARGFEGGGEPLTGAALKDVSSIMHVTSVVQTLTDRLSKEGTTSSFGSNSNNSTPQTNTTNLTSAIDPGTLGSRNNGGGSGRTVPANFSLPIQVIGANNLSVASALNVSQFNITSGQAFDVNTIDNEALVGTTLASKNSLSVGSTFTAYSQTIKVDGIFDAGSDFSNATLIMPLGTLQKLSSQSDQVSSAIVSVDSVDNVSGVSSAIKTSLGDKADVESSTDAINNSLAPLENVKSISLYSLIGSLVAGAVIIFLIMMMIVRERRREIGILKAIGASNIKIVSQFVTESLTLSIMGSIVGIVLGFILANPILKVLLNNATSSSTGGSAGGGGVTGRGFTGGGQAAFRALRGFGGGLQSNLSSLHATVGTDMILYGILAALAIAVLGSAIPAFFISKVRPAEVMRSE